MTETVDFGFSVGRFAAILGAALGIAVGVVAAWNAGGVGGIFGWGPGG